jgi:hypothetical protein
LALCAHICCTSETLAITNTEATGGIQVVSSSATFTRVTIAGAAASGALDTECVLHKVASFTGGAGVVEAVCAGYRTLCTEAVGSEAESSVAARAEVFLTGRTAHSTGNTLAVVQAGALLALVAGSVGAVGTQRVAVVHRTNARVVDQCVAVLADIADVASATFTVLRTLGAEAVVCKPVALFTRCAEVVGAG